MLARARLGWVLILEYYVARRSGGPGGIRKVARAYGRGPGFGGRNRLM